MRVPITLVAYLVMTFAPVSIEWVEAQSVVDDLRPGVVKLTAQVMGKNKVGTGFLVRLEKESAYIVTAAHVIQGDAHPRVSFYNAPDRSYLARIIGIEDGDDGLAVVVVRELLPVGLKTLTFDIGMRLDEGTPINLIGFPPNLHTSWTVMRGNFNGFKGRQLTFQAPVNEGHSGGPLLVRGRVAGVVTRGDGQYGFAVPFQIVLLTLRGWRIEPQSHAIPVHITGTLGADGWRLAFNIHDRVTQVFYKLANDDEFKSTGVSSQHVDRETGLPFPNLWTWGLKISGPVTVYLKYIDLEGIEQGPYELRFDPTEARLKQLHDDLFNQAPGRWLAYMRDENQPPRLLVYFTYLIGYKDVLREIRYSVDDETVARKLTFETWTEPTYPLSSPKDEIYVLIPLDAKFVSVKLVFINGTESEVVKFPLPTHMTPGRLYQ